MNKEYDYEDENVDDDEYSKESLSVAACRNYGYTD